MADLFLGRQGATAIAYPKFNIRRDIPVIASLGASLVVGAQELEPQLPEEIAGKELSELLEDWPDQYVRWIITDAEREVYENLLTTPTDRRRAGRALRRGSFGVLVQ